MTAWFVETDESRRMLAEERLVLAASEIIAEALERRGRTRTWLAKALSIKLPEVSQRLSGKRNMTLKSLAGMLHTLDYGVEIRLVDKRSSRNIVFHDAREMDWPAGNMRYTQTRTPILMINGGVAA